MESRVHSIVDWLNLETESQTTVDAVVKAAVDDPRDSAVKTIGAIADLPDTAVSDQAKVRPEERIERSNGDDLPAATVDRLVDEAPTIEGITWPQTWSFDALPTVIRHLDDAIVSQKIESNGSHVNDRVSDLETATVDEADSDRPTAKAVVDPISEEIAYGVDGVPSSVESGDVNDDVVGAQEPTFAVDEAVSDWPTVDERVPVVGADDDRSPSETRRLEDIRDINAIVWPRVWAHDRPSAPSTVIAPNRKSAWCRMKSFFRRKLLWIHRKSRF